FLLLSLSHTLFFIFFSFYIFSPPLRRGFTLRPWPPRVFQRQLRLLIQLGPRTYPLASGYDSIFCRLVYYTPHFYEWRRRRRAAHAFEDVTPLLPRARQGKRSKLGAVGRHALCRDIWSS